MRAHIPACLDREGAVAVHPDPEGALEAQIASLTEKVAAAPSKEKPELEAEPSAGMSIPGPFCESLPP